MERGISYYYCAITNNYGWDAPAFCIDDVVLRYHGGRMRFTRRRGLP